MIGYATIGANDLEKAKGFYDKILAPLGGKRAFDTERMQGYADAEGRMVVICKPYDGKDASVGNGTMFGLLSPSTAAVDEVYKTAIAAGATCEGPPGARSPNFYGAYFRDLDGNKLCAFART